MLKPMGDCETCFPCRWAHAAESMLPLKKFSAEQSEARRSWVRLLVVALNFIFGGKTRFFAGPAREAQAVCLGRLAQAAEVWVELKDELRLAYWEQKLKKRRVNYNGDEVESPGPLTWRQIQPGLLLPGLAGCLDPEQFTEGYVLELLRDPTTC